MSIRVQCKECSKRYTAPEDAAGMQATCPGCGRPLNIPPREIEPTDPSSSSFDLSGGLTDGGPATTTLVAPAAKRTAANKPVGQKDDWHRRMQPRRAAGTPRRIRLPISARSVVAGLAVVTATALLIWLAPAVRSLLWPGDGANDGVSSTALPGFPDPGPFRSLQPGVQHAAVTLQVAPDQPGRAGRLHVYLPSGTHAPRSLPCVFIAPGGMEPFGGCRLGSAGDGEHIPYVKAGFAAVAYEVDGPLPAGDDSTDEEIQKAFRDFQAARAGLVNGHNALEYTLARVPAVNPDRLYAAGHGSAGSLALLLAAHEPRIRGCIAYAPVSDAKRQLAGRIDELEPILPDLHDFLAEHSLRTHVRELRCPAFLFHARGDRAVPVSASIDFAEHLRRRGKPVTMRIVSGGDHYKSMIAQGIPDGIRWLKRRQGPVDLAAAMHHVKPSLDDPAPSKTPEAIADDPDRLVRLNVAGRGDISAGGVLWDAAETTADASFPWQEDAGLPAPQTSFSPPKLTGIAYDEASLEYTRQTIIDVIAGEDAVVQRRLRWAPLPRRPMIAVRWGLGVHFPNGQAPPKNELAQTPEQWTGEAVPKIVARLNRRIAAGRYGQWPGGWESKQFRDVSWLGQGDKTALLEAAASQGIDAFLLATVTATEDSTSGETIRTVKIRVVDAAVKTPEWSSSPLTLRQVASAEDSSHGPGNLVEEVLRYIEEGYALRPMPDLRADLARRRADSLAGMTWLEPLQRLVETRYYHAKGLLTDDEAIAVYDKILGAGKGVVLATGDESQRREVLRAVRRE